MNRKGLRWLRYFAEHKEIWRLSRRSVPRGIALGCFFSMLPIPFQTLPVAVFAVLVRGNVLLAVACVWITNPFTMVPIYYINYRIGAVLLGTESIPEQEWSLDTVIATVVELWVGSVVVGLVLAGLGYAASVVWYRIRIARHWSRRASKRLAEGK